MYSVFDVQLTYGFSPIKHWEWYSLHSHYSWSKVPRWRHRIELSSPKIAPHNRFFDYNYLRLVWQHMWKSQRSLSFIPRVPLFVHLWPLLHIAFSWRIGRKKGREGRGCMMRTLRSNPVRHIFVVFLYHSIILYYDLSILLVFLSMCAST